MNQIEQDSIEWNLVQRHLKNFVFHFCKVFSHFEKYQERKLHYRHCKNKVICYHLWGTIVKPWAQLESGIDELSGPSGDNCPRSGPSRVRRRRIVKVRVALSRLCLAGQTYKGQFFSKIWTESGQRTDTGQDFPENTRTKTRQGHGTDSAVRRRLPTTDSFFPSRIRTKDRIEAVCPDLRK